MTRRRSVTREVVGAVRHVTGSSKPARRNPWPKCTTCFHRASPEAVCLTCGACATCCNKCDRCGQCPYACPGHRDDQKET